MEAYKISKDNAAHPKISAESVSVRGLEEIPYLVLEFALYCNFMSQSSLGVGPGSDPAAELMHVTQTGTIRVLYKDQNWGTFEIIIRENTEKQRNITFTCNCVM